MFFFNMDHFVQRSNIFDGPLLSSVSELGRSLLANVALYSMAHTALNETRLIVPHGIYWCMVNKMVFKQQLHSFRLLIRTLQNI